MNAFLTLPELEKGLAKIKESPRKQGTLALIVCRPEENERKVLPVGKLTFNDGLVGDYWREKGSKKTIDGSPNVGEQVNLMNSRSINLIAGTKQNWPLAGDQLFVDFDLSESNAPAGTRLKIGSCIIEITPIPHNGCKKFAQRYGVDAMKFVNSTEGKKLHLRGLHAKVVQEGEVRPGDKVEKLPSN